MPYYVRILTPSEAVPSFAKLKAAVTQLGGLLEGESNADDSWTQIVLSHPDGWAIADIERNSAVSGDLVAAELEEFIDEIQDCYPTSAVEWLSNYLPSVRAIYAFQILSGVDNANGWDLLGAVQDAIQSDVGGIIQADAEGFNNPDGFHILWQYSDSASGPERMGVLLNGKWVHFQMDLGNEEHRRAFLRGEVPEDAELIRPS